MAEQYYMGVDGGGTHTRVLLTDRSGHVLGTGNAGSTNRNHHTRSEVRSNLRSALLESLGNRPLSQTVSTIFLGMCGVSTDADRQDIITVVREIPEVGSRPRVGVENDTHIGLTGGLSGRPGMVLIAGTGSACFGINSARKIFMGGGWGALVDDVGSGPWIGVRALRAAVQAEDGRIGPTILRDIVFKFLDLGAPRQFIDRVHNQGLDRAQIGKLAPMVIDAYRQGDVVAGEILHSAALELSRLVSATVQPLFGQEPCEMILVGGVALSGPPFQPMLIDQIKKMTPNVSVRDPEMSPVQGAILCALQADGIAWSDEILKNLRTSAT